MSLPEFVKVAESKDLPPGSLKTVNVNQKAVLLANVQGEIYAIGAICNHAGWDLSLGRLEENILTCAGHGSMWDVKTGQCVKFFRPLPPEPRFEVKVEGESIYVKV